MCKVIFASNKPSVNNIAKMLIVTVLILVNSTLESVAQTNQNKFWNRIESESILSHTWSARWKMRMTSFPDKNMNVEKLIALQKERLLKSGMVAKNVDQQLASMKMTFENIKSGYSTQGEYDIISDGVSTRVDIMQSSPITLEKGINRKSAFQSRYLDIFDGKNSTSLTSIGTSLPSSGVVTREKKDILRYLTPNFAEPIFFLRTPITNFFSKQNSKITLSTNSDLELERSIYPDKLNYISHLRLSSNQLLPIVLTRNNEFDKKLIAKIEAFAYKKYHNDFYYPSRIVETNFLGSGDRQSEYEFVLLNFREGDVSDIETLAHPIPQGAFLLDARFGNANAPSYRLKKDLPSDEIVTELIAKTVAGRKQFDNEQHRTILLRIAEMCVAVTFAIVTIVVIIRKFAKR